jgi:hypothetical protein
MLVAIVCTQNSHFKNIIFPELYVACEYKFKTGYGLSCIPSLL